MAEMVYERARREAVGIRNGYPVGTSGTRDLEIIAERLGANVYFEPLPQDQAGFIVKENKDAFAIIVINSNDISERQRFTLAHEIGHLVDRRRIAADDDYSFMDFRDGQQEYNLHEFFADEFAGELLMPAQPLIDSAYEHGIYAAAARFGVTPAAVQKRLDRLRTHPPAELVADDF